VKDLLTKAIGFTIDQLKEIATNSIIGCIGMQVDWIIVSEEMHCCAFENLFFDLLKSIKSLDSPSYFFSFTVVGKQHM
jgi:hypothetical protein